MDYDNKEGFDGGIADYGIVLLIVVDEHNNRVEGCSGVDFCRVVNQIFRASSFTDVVFRIVHSNVERSHGDCKQRPKAYRAVL
jgi:hypothetical protein